MPRALINQNILQWALERAEIAVDDLSRRLQVGDGVVEAWLSGEKRPTFNQAKKLANILGIPFGYLYLKEPPREELPIADFRTVGSQRGYLDANTRALLNDVLFKRDWFKEFREQNGFEPLRFVGKFSIDSNPQEVAGDVSETLLAGEGRPARGTYEQFLQKLMTQAEAVGIWVMRTGVVGNNTQRPLSVRTFRGLTIADPIVPLILINGRDSKAAQIFTFVHELAHLWIGESGVSNPHLEDAKLADYGVVERFCNAVAAEFLTPEGEFKELWQEAAGLEQIDVLANHFKVSRAGVARRARDLGFISNEVYQEFFAQEQARWRDINTEQGGNFYNNVPARNGKQFTFSVASEAMKGALLIRHAASLLGVQPKHVKHFYHQLRA